MDDRVAGVVAARRLSRGRADTRRFTIERVEARLRLRDRPGSDAHEWSLVLVRGLLALADAATVTLIAQPAEAGGGLVLEIGIDPSVLVGLKLADLLDAAINPDPGPGSGSLGHRQERFVRLIGRALNEALAADPDAITIVIPDAGRRVERVPGSSADDPYAERPYAGHGRAGQIRIEIKGRASKALFGSGWRPDRVARQLVQRWRERVPGLVDRGSNAVDLRAVPPGQFVRLGAIARWWPRSESGPLLLMRDGVLVPGVMERAVAERVPVGRMAGVVEAPFVHLVVDETAIVRDSALDELIAWLLDAQAHAIRSGDGDDHTTAITAVEFPTTLAAVETAAGVAVPLETLQQTTKPGPEFYYAWRPDAAAVPSALRTTTLILWPSERELLERAMPDLQLVPLQVLQMARGGWSDLTAIEQGSLPALPLGAANWNASDREIAIDLSVLVHRHPVGQRGAAILLGFERRLAEGDPSEVIPGITLVGRVDRLFAETAARAVTHPEYRASAIATMVAKARAQMSEIVAYALRHDQDDGGLRVPVVRAAVASCSAATLGLRYVVSTAGVRLAWEDSPLTQLVVAQTRDGVKRTLGAALVRARDVGGIVIGDPTHRWHVLEQDEEVWLPTAVGRDLLARVLPAAALWTMPCVPASQIHVAPAAEQRRLLLDREEVARSLLRVASDPRARSLLLGHLLVARALGESTQGLADIALLSIFDPRAVTAQRLWSSTMRANDRRRFALAPWSTATRDLTGCVVEASPGEAALLHEVMGLGVDVEEGGEPLTSPTNAAASPVGVRTPSPLLSLPIADALAVGAIHLFAEEDRPAIELWAAGLRVGEMSLPSPLAAIGGRLWLSDAGVRAGHAGIENMLLTHGRVFVRTALASVALTPPGTARRRTLRRFIDHVRAAVAAGGDRFRLAPIVAERRAPAVLGNDHAKAVRLPQLRRLWLSTLLRHALGRPHKIDSAWLSWTAAQLRDPSAPIWEIELGSRHRWIKRASDDEAGLDRVGLAAVLVAASVLAQARVEGPALPLALLRILAALHVAPRS